MRLEARIVVVIVQHKRRTQAFSTHQKGSLARSRHNNNLAQAALKNFVQLHRNQHQCLRSGKMMEDSDSPELTYMEGCSGTPLDTEELGFQFCDHVMGANHES